MTKLVTDLTGLDPDEFFSVVPYEKGSVFLYYLEEKVGGPGKKYLEGISICIMACSSLQYKQECA